MGRTYAGILGLTAFLTIIARSVLHGGDPASALRWACIGLIMMTCIGAVIGRLAAWAVDESVREKMNAELAAHEAALEMEQQKRTADEAA